jgi:hypothetical protein
MAVVILSACSAGSSQSSTQHSSPPASVTSTLSGKPKNCEDLVGHSVEATLPVDCTPADPAKGHNPWYQLLGVPPNALARTCGDIHQDDFYIVTLKTEFLVGKHHGVWIAAPYIAGETHGTLNGLESRLGALVGCHPTD